MYDKNPCEWLLVPSGGLVIGGFRPVHVVSSVTVITEQQLVLHWQHTNIYYL